MSSVTDIKDFHGNRVKAVVAFDYKDYCVSISTISSNCNIVVFGEFEGGDVVGSFATVQEAIEYINMLTTD